MHNIYKLFSTSQDLFVLKEAFIDFLDELGAKDAKIHFEELELMRGDFFQYLKTEENYAKGINLQPGYVSTTRFWYIQDNQRIIGTICLHHQLNDNLKDYGGHIGYIVRPTERNKGYASQMLALVIEEARKMGIKEILLTCDPDNYASRKTIEKNGGVLQGEHVSKTVGKLKAYYWIGRNL